MRLSRFIEDHTFPSTISPNAGDMSAGQDNRLSREFAAETREGLETAARCGGEPTHSGALPPS
jgi:hypothetical protein